MQRSSRQRKLKEDYLVVVLFFESLDGMMSDHNQITQLMCPVKEHV